MSDGKINNNRQDEKKQLDVEKSKSKPKKSQIILKEKRRQKSLIQARKQEIKKGNTQYNAHISAVCRLARYARGVEQRYEQKNKHTVSPTKSTRETKRD